MIGGAANIIVCCVPSDGIACGTAIGTLSCSAPFVAMFCHTPIFCAKLQKKHETTKFIRENFVVSCYLLT